MRTPSKAKIERMVNKLTIRHGKKLDEEEERRKKEREDKEKKDVEKRVKSYEWLEAQLQGGKKKAPIDTGAETLEAEDIKDESGESI